VRSTKIRPATKIPKMGKPLCCCLDFVETPSAAAISFYENNAPGHRLSAGSREPTSPYPGSKK